MSAQTLVVELCTEELPPKALKLLGEAFAEGVAAGLRQREFLTAESKVVSFATPRRLAVSITDVLAEARDTEIVEKLMPVAHAVDASAGWTPAARKKLQKMGRESLADTYPDLSKTSEPFFVRTENKIEYVWLRTLAKGGSLLVGLEGALADAIDKLPIPKLMSYQRPDGSTVKFARPAHYLLALHGRDEVPVEALGLKAGRKTLGHRFMGRREIDLAEADEYAATLAAAGKVIASFGERRARIAEGLEAAARKSDVAGATPIMPETLLDEVTALVEWPVIYAGEFDPAFLQLPHECLVVTMQQNQKYFALADRGGHLIDRFLLVSNLETGDPGPIIQGNERVLRARLADAKFFFDQDRKQTLESRVPKLASVVYHNKLGSRLDRVQRVSKLAAVIGEMLAADAGLVQRAAWLAKADLITDMVGEFPELQGLMGRFYALHDGEPDAVAYAIEQHYWPRFAGDKLPQGAVAQSLALADKLETLAGMFGIRNVPTGDKDPLGLRRQAVGVLRILMEGELALRLRDLIEAAYRSLEGVANVVPAHAELEVFMVDRLRGYLREQGYSALQVEAVVSRGSQEMHLIPQQMEAIKAFSVLPEASALAAANKRVGNILRKSEAEVAAEIDTTLLSQGAEQELYQGIQALLPVVRNHMSEGNYTEALRALASVREPVDRFFDDVMVMVEDVPLRRNRLAVLRELQTAMNQVADISKLAG